MRLNRVTGDIEARKISVLVTPEEHASAIASLGGHQQTLSQQGELVLELHTGLEISEAQWVRYDKLMDTGMIQISIGSRDE